MRVTGLRVDGFGILHEQYIESIPPGLSLFYGDNESGKSTLHAFLRYMLFGFPDGRSKENPYPPLRGGEYGGNLKCQNASDELYVVERRAGSKGGKVTVNLPDGSKDGKAALNRLLGNATREMYNSVFAFTLSELQRLDALEDEEAKTAIYSAGMGTGNASLPELEENLENELKRLFEPDAPKGRIQAATERLEKIRTEKSSAAKNADRYDQLCSEIADKETEIAELEKKNRKAQERLRESENLLKAWDDWVELREAESDLEELPEIKSMPRNGISRLERLQDKREEINKRISELEYQIKETEKNIEAMEVNDQLLECAREIENLQKGRDRFDTESTELERLKQQAEEYEKKLSEALQEMGRDWDRERLEELDGSLPQKEQIRSYKQQLNELTEQLSGIKGRLEMAEEATGRAREEKEKAERNFSEQAEPAETDLDTFQQKRKKLRTVQEYLADMPALKKEVEHASGNLEGCRAELEKLQTRRDAAGRGLPVWLTAPFGAAGFALAAVLAVISGPWAGIGIAAATIPACAFYFAFSRKRKTRINRQLKRLQREIEKAEKNSEEAEKQRKKANKKMLDARNKIASLCEDMDIDIPEGVIETGELIDELDSDIEELKNWLTEKETVEKAQENLQTAENTHQQIKDRHDKIQEKIDEVERAWEQWLQSAGLPSNLSPDGALEMFAKADECRNIAENLDEMQARIRRIESSLQEYASQVRKVAEVCGKETEHEHEAGLLLDSLSSELETARNAQNERNVMERSLEELSAQLENSSGERKTNEKQIAALLEEAGAEDENDFRNKAETDALRNKLEEKQKTHLSAIKKIAGMGEKLVDFREKLENSSPEELETMRKEAGKNCLEIENRSKEITQKYGSLIQERKALESEDRLGQLRLEEKFCQNAISDAVRRWCVLKLSLQLFRKTRRRYEKERQPEVLRNSNEFLRMLTGGNYHRIAPSEKETDSLMVIDNAESKKEVELLSRGTREQLYLALRFGLIKEFSQHQDPLPVIMDDVIVNFDPTRARAAAEAMMSLAQTNQILFFVCHPEICDIVREVNPETPLFHIEDGCIRRE